MKQEFGTVTFEGVEYILRQNPYPDYRSGYVNPSMWWSASALREDELDEDGEPSILYRIWWREMDNVDKTNANETNDYVDWDNPWDVEAV